MRLKPSPTNTLVTALGALNGRCDEIRELAYDRNGGIQKVFSDREIEKTIDICLTFGTAVSNCSVEEISDLAEQIEATRVKVLDTNSALNNLMTENPTTMAFVNISENWLLERLVSAPAFMISLAKYQRLVMPIMRFGLRFLFTDIRNQTGHATPKTKSRRNRIRDDFMRGQYEDFESYLVDHPITASCSRLMRAHECWNLHQEAWDKAAEEGIGYSDYKALGRTPRNRCRKV